MQRVFPFKSNINESKEKSDDEKINDWKNLRPLNLNAKNHTLERSCFSTYLWCIQFNCVLLLAEYGWKTIKFFDGRLLLYGKWSIKGAEQTKTKHIHESNVEKPLINIFMNASDCYENISVDSVAFRVRIQNKNVRCLLVDFFLVFCIIFAHFIHSTFFSWSVERSNDWIYWSDYHIFLLTFPV